MKRLRAIFKHRLTRYFALVMVSLPLLVYAVFAIAVWLLPFPSELARHPPASTWMTDRHGNAIAACVAADDQWRFPLSPDEISPHLLSAIIAVEDARFFQHNGVDWKSVGGSAWENLISLRTRRGASTLSMQLVRLRMPMSRRLTGKSLQAVRARQLEQRNEKQQILLDYLNEAPFGGNLVGAGAAAWRYFAKPCAQLSLAEAALLAALPQNPNVLRPDRFPDRARSRRDHVLSRMLELRFISESQYTEALREPITAKWLPLPQMQDDGSLPTLLRLAELHRGQHVRLALDPSAQQTANQLTREHLAALQPANISAAAVVVLDTQTSEVLAAVSATDQTSRLDLTVARRSTGSTLKPFLYAAAVDAGIISMSSILEDHPKAWGSYLPANYDRGFTGELTAAEALASSRNIPAMTVLARTGISRTVNLLGACGIRSVTNAPQRHGLPLAAGGAEASPLELAEAYATLARGGRHKGTRFEINAHRLFDESTVLTRETSLQVLFALADRERASQVCPEASRTGVAWKTGTSSGHRDAWCAAVTPRITVVVWLGNLNGDGSSALAGTDTAAPLALRLIAAMDAGSGGFESPAQDTRTLAHTPLLRPSIAILSPADGQRLIVESAVASYVDLKAQTNRQRETLFWFVDGNPLQSARWVPTRGTHEIRVVDSDGTSASANVHVEVAQ